MSSKTNPKKCLIIAAAFFIASCGNAKADFTFGTPTNLGPTVNSSTWDLSPSIPADGLTLYFTSRRPGGYGSWDLWVATRATTDNVWSKPVNLGPTVNSSVRDITSVISADGLSLFFGSNRPGGSGGRDIWVTTRATTEDDWGTPVNLGPTVNSSNWDNNPSISADGLSLFFDSKRPGGSGGTDLWVTTRPTTDDSWGTPVNLGPTVNGPYSDGLPGISADGLALFFSSYEDEPIRPGGLGGSDIWVTTRATVSDSWGPPVNLGPPVNTSADDISQSISADGLTLYFTSRRPGGYGNYDIWQAPIEPVVDFNGDGIVDAADMCIMVDYWGTDEPLCDIGPMPWGDGIVDVQDLLVLAEYLTEEKVDVEADIAAIEDVLNQYALAMNTGDLDLWLSFNTDDIVKMPPDEPAIFGKEDLRASMKPLFDNFTIEMAIYPEETQVDGDLGYSWCTYTLSLTPNEGGEPIFVDGKALGIYKRQDDGSWKLSHDCFNSNVPPTQ